VPDRVPPPVAPRKPVVRELHGRRDVDNYAWMRDHSAPAMQEYLAAERAYYDAETGHLAALTKELLDEAVARTPQGTDDSVSWTQRGYHYVYRTPAGAEGKQLIRWGDGESPADGQAPGGSGGSSPRASTVLLDEDVIGAESGYVDVGTCEPSPDGRLLAWSADTSGAEIYELRFRDTETGQDLADVVERSYPGGAWTADSAYFFYLVPDALNRPYQMWRHEIGSAPGTDVLVYEESDERFELFLRASRSGELIALTSESRDTTEVLILPAARPLDEPVVVAPRRPGVEYRVDHAADPSGGAGELLIVTDDGAAEFRLMRTPADAPGRENWSEVPCPAIAPARDDTRLARCDVLAGHLVLTLRRDGSPLLAITGLDGGAGGGVREIWPAVPAGSIAVAHAEDYAAGSVIVVEESLIQPRAWSALDLATGQRRELKRAEVPGYAPARYRTRRLVATVSDGTGVPVTIAYRDGTPLDGTAPCLLYGYGAYESCLDPEFETSVPSVLDRGVVYAVAHVRGGGECGRNWWQQGRLRAKPTTFSDFIDVASWLAGDSGGGPALVDGRRIVSRGLSAGGLLQGAVYSRAPGRWRAVVAEVPFVDCVTTMLDPDIPLTISEWDEWGDPRDPDDFACLRAYSPYDNPPAGPRPALLVTGAVHDPRVLVHEPAKWVARLRETDTDGSTVLFRVELGAGAHTGPSGRYGHLRSEAEVYAFILDALQRAR
jgi:oligopeptidase B